jgi:two-component system, sensor histidine kinase LadS
MKKNLLFLLLLLSSFNSFAQRAIIYDDSTKLLEMSYYARVLTDEKHEHTIESIQKLPDSAFRQSKIKLNLGTTPARIWSKFYIDNKTSEDLYFLTYSEDVFEIDLYAFDEKGKIEIVSTGLRKHNNSNFKNLTNTFIYRFKTQPKILYISTYSLNTSILIFKIGAYQAISNLKHLIDLFYGIFMGLLLITSFYNIVLYFASKDSLFLYYGIYVFFSCLAMLSLDGILVEWLWRFFGFETFVFGNFLNPTILIPIGIFWAALFSTKFLYSKEYSPIFYYLIWTFTLCNLMVYTLKCFGYLYRYEIEYGYFIIFLVIFFNGLYLAIKGIKSARYFTFAWGVYIFGIFLMLFSSFEILSYEHFYTVFGYHLGAIAEVILMSVAVVRRIMLNRQEINDAKELAFQRLHDNERIIEEHNLLLRQNLLNNSVQSKPQNNENKVIKKINIPTLEGVILLPIADVVRLEALGSYTNILLSIS